MALSRVKSWIAEVLTFSDLNAEFNNILNNANSLISPFTANVSGGAFSLTNLGGLIVGNTATAVTAGSAHASQFLGTSAATSGEVHGMFSADAVGANISFAKSRNATIGSHTIVQSGDDVGTITWYGSNGTSFDPCARILGEVGGTPGAATDMPGALVFYTTPDGSVTLTERFRITAAGSPQFANLTSGRVVFTTTSGGLTDSAVLTFSSPTLSIVPVTDGTLLLLDGDISAGPGVSPTIDIRANSFSQSAVPQRILNPNVAGDSIFIEFLTEAAPGSQRGSIDYNRAGGLTRYNTTSDYRLKDIYGAFTGALDLLSGLKVHRGKMKDATLERPMMLAHEAQEIAPYAVSGKKDELDDEGKPRYQMMDHQILVPLLVAALQEANARIAALEARLA